MKELQPCDYAIFQEGRLKAFATPLQYMERGEEYTLNVRVTKGSIMEGTHELNIARTFDVFVDGTIGRMGTS